MGVSGRRVRARCGGIVNNTTPVRALDAPTLYISHRTPHALYVFGGGVNMTSVVRLAHLYLWADRNTTKCGDNVLPPCLCVSGDPRALLPTRTHLARAPPPPRHSAAEHMIALCSPINSWSITTMPFPSRTCHSLRTVDFLTGYRFTQLSEL